MFLENLRKRNFIDVLPLFSIESDLLIFKDGRVGIGYQIEPHIVERRVSFHYDALNLSNANTLKGWPVHATAQKLDFFFFTEFMAKPKTENYFERQLINHYLHRPVLKHQSFLFLTFAPKGKLSKANAFTSLYAAGKAMIRNPFKGVDQLAAQAQHHAKEYVSSLKTQGIRSRRLTTAELKDVYQAYFNLEFDRPQKMFSHSFTPLANGLAVGNKLVNVLSLMGQGENVYNSRKNVRRVESPFIYPLALGLQVPHVLSTSIVMENQRKVLKSLDDDRAWNERLDLFMTQDNEIKFKDLKEFTQEIREGGKPVVNFNTSLILYSPDEFKLGEYVEMGKAAFREMSGAECYVESIDTASLFVANAPGNALQNYRWLLMNAENACAYNNYITNYRSAELGELLADRYGNPVWVSLFDVVRENNHNAVVIGPPGSGKSFSVGALMIQRKDQGHRQIIIDKGGTYKSAVTALKGKYYEYDPERPLKFNPFGSVPKKNDAYVLTKHKTNYLIALLGIMWQGVSGSLTNPQVAIMRKVVQSYYTFFNRKRPDAVPSVKGFFKFLVAYRKRFKGTEKYQIAQRYLDFDQFIICLEPFAYGQYADVFDLQTEDNLLDHKLVCFDMESIQEDHTLYPVVTMLIVDLVTENIRQYKKDRKYIYMDEAWAMISDRMGKFVETLFRTIRKQKGAMYLITQGYKEIVEAPAGHGMLVSTNVKILLNHPDVTQLENLAAFFGMTQHETELGKSLRIENDRREIFIKYGNNADVFWLELPKHMYPVLTSHAHEREHLRDLEKKYHGNIYHAVSQYVEDQKAGVI